MGHAALHIHPTRYMCVYGVCVRGYNIWLVNTTAADVKSQRQKDTRIHTYVCIDYVHKC